MNSKPLNIPFAWSCPFCNSTTTINEHDFSVSKHELKITTKHGTKYLFTYFIVCPNTECKEYSLILQLFNRDWTPNIGSLGEFEKEITIIPSFIAKSYPTYIPQPIRDDYYEACQIRELSPKASATLSRRCLQGMIRDFWGIKKSRLIDEISELESKVDTLTWQAIDAVRKIGNIGAHMEKDVNVVIDVEPAEASLLLGLIENLMQDWYIARHDREIRLKEIVEMGSKKEAQVKAKRA